MDIFDKDVIRTNLWRCHCEMVEKANRVGEDKILDKYTELIALSIEHDCCDLYSVEDMLELINRGAINHYDGGGYWLDKDFNKVGYVFDGDTVPEGAVWADWYNK